MYEKPTFTRLTQKRKVRFNHLRKIIIFKGNLDNPEKKAIFADNSKRQQ